METTEKKLRQCIDIPTTLFCSSEQLIELTHRKTHGWVGIQKSVSNRYLNSATKVVYLGRCDEDGDMFAVYAYGYIMVFKGHLNSGKY